MTQFTSISVHKQPKRSDTAIRIQVSNATIIISREDRDLVDLKWAMNGSGYASSTVSRQGSKLMHRLILSRKLGRPMVKGEFVDHINRNKLDNRRQNLRLATPAQNRYNVGIQKNNKSGFKGVTWTKAGKCFEAKISIKDIRQHIGYFNTAEEAAHAYDRAALYYYGEFASPNYPVSDYNQLPPYVPGQYSARATKTSSVYKGVSWHKPRRKWEVSIAVNKVKHYLGLFVDEVEAACAYDAAVLKMGLNRSTNFPGVQSS